jgi:hypothetical protein
MSSFTTPLQVEILDDMRGDRVQARLLVPFSYDVGDLGSGETICVPAGFVTDFASIPRAFWRLEPPLGRSGKAAVVHDYLYSTRGLDGRYDRTRCDEIFREAMAVLGVPMIKRNLMWAAVRVGGGKGWGS